jgi:hypothetical protein
MAGGAKLGRKQEAAIVALMTEATVEQAAAKAGVGYRTLKGWLALPDFRDAYRAAQKQVIEAAVNRLRNTLDKAAEALERNLTCDRPATQVRAAIAVFDTLFKGVDHLELVGRIEALEQQAEAAKLRRQWQ